MRIAKCVTLSVVVTVAGLAALAVAAGQDNPAKPQQTSPRTVSGTRLASCVVRITADPTLVTLNPEIVRGMIYSSGVVGKATREVLQRDLLGDAERLLQIQWLDMSDAASTPAGSLTNEAYDEQMMREMEQIYGAEYMQVMQGQQNVDQGGDDRKEQPTAKTQSQSTGASRPSRSSGTANPYGGGGYGGGMGRPMGGMGLGGMGGMMGRAGQTAFVRLSVGLPNDMVPVANEFLDAVVTNLEATLLKAYDNHVSRLRELLTRVEDQQHRAEAGVRGEADDAPLSARIREQLNMIVDLDLNPQMALADAVEVLKRSVQPPLNIVVLWNDLASYLRVQPTSPCSIDGMVRVRLGTALDLFVKGLPPGSDKPIWMIKDNVIVIGMAATLGQSREPAGKPRVETDARTLAFQKSELERNVQSLELELAGQEARQNATEEQIQRARVMADTRLAQDPVTQELEKLVEINTTNLATLRKQADSGRLSSVELAKAEESLTRAKIELAQRREELSKQVGGGQLEQFNNELARMAIDRAEKEMQQKVLQSQLQEVQQRLAQASVFDPQAARMRIAQGALDMIARRIADLQMSLASLQPPTVTVIGAD